MCSSTGSRSLRASSGSRSASSSIEPFRSANSTVTCLRSPSRAVLGGEDLLGQVLRACSAPGGPNLAVGIVRSGAAHWPQNLFSGGFPAPQDGQVEASGAAHSPQNFMPVEFSCWQRGHCMPEPPRHARTGTLGLGGSLGGPGGRVKAGVARPRAARSPNEPALLEIGIDRESWHHGGGRGRVSLPVSYTTQGAKGLRAGPSTT